MSIYLCILIIMMMDDPKRCCSVRCAVSAKQSGTFLWLSRVTKSKSNWRWETNEKKQNHFFFCFQFRAELWPEATSGKKARALDSHTHHVPMCGQTKAKLNNEMANERCKKKTCIGVEWMDRMAQHTQKKTYCCSAKDVRIGYTEFSMLNNKEN